MKINELTFIHYIIMLQYLCIINVIVMLFLFKLSFQRRKEDFFIIIKDVRIT